MGKVTINGKVIINGKNMQQTSLDAWHSLQPDGLSKRENQIFKIVFEAGAQGIAIHEIEREAHLRNCSVSPRITGLQKKNLIQDTGKRVLTPSGRWAIRWVVTPDPAP